MKEYTLSQTAKIVGISKYTLRYYDKMGLLKSHRRENNYRYYDDNSIFALKYIEVLKYVGFHLEEISELFHEQERKGNCCTDTSTSIELMNNKREQTKNKIEILKNVLNIFDLSIALLTTEDIVHPDKITETVNGIYEDIKTTKRKKE